MACSAQDARHQELFGANVHSAEVGRPELSGLESPFMVGVRGAPPGHAQPRTSPGSSSHLKHKPLAASFLGHLQASNRHRHCCPSWLPAPISESRHPINLAPVLGPAGTHCFSKGATGRKAEPDSGRSLDR